MEGGWLDGVEEVATGGREAYKVRDGDWATARKTHRERAAAASKTGNLLGCRVARADILRETAFEAGWFRLLSHDGLISQYPISVSIPRFHPAEQGP